MPARVVGKLVKEAAKKVAGAKAKGGKVGRAIENKMRSEVGLPKGKTTGKTKAATKGRGLRVEVGKKVRFVGDNDSYIPTTQPRGSGKRKFISKNKNISKETERYEVMPPYTSRRAALKYSSKAKNKTTSNFNPRKKSGRAR